MPVPLSSAMEEVQVLVLMTVAVVLGIAAGCALQCNFVRRERTGLLRLRLRFGCGRFGGFAGMADIGTADGVHHMTGRSAAGHHDFNRQRQSGIIFP
jgi:hypothetical protein